VDSGGRTIFVADAHRDDGQRFIVHADEKLAAFTELESAIRGSLFATLANLSRKLVANVSFVIGDLPQSLASPNLLHLSA
jgi:hypothetical protein